MGEGKTRDVPSQVIVDGIEGDKVRVEVEPGLTVDWDKASLPEGVREGDVIHIEGQGEEQHLKVDHVETKKRREQTQAELDALNQRPTGEIDL